jgi:hypothetical protein
VTGEPVLAQSFRWGCDPRLLEPKGTLNCTSMSRPPSANSTTGMPRWGAVKHQVKPMCQPSVGVGHDRPELPPRGCLTKLPATRLPATRYPLPAVCENFLYGFKAARRAARAAASARSPSLPLALPLRRRQRRSAGAKNTKPGAA